MTLYAKVLFDGSGNATVIDSEVINAGTSPVTINPSNGFVGGAVTSPGTGIYAFALQDPYVRFLGATFTEQGSNNIGGVAWTGTDADIQSNTAPVLGLVFSDWAGAAAAPTSVTVLLCATFANSTAL